MTALRLFIVVAVALAVPVVGSVQPAAAEQLDWRAAADELARRGPAPGSPPVLATRSAKPVHSDPAPRPKATGLIAASSARVTLGRPGEARRLDRSPIELAARDADTTGRAVRVEVLDAEAAARAGVSGFVFRMSEDGSSALPLTLSVDYTAFAERFGAGYADRLHLVTLPPCAIRIPVPDDCSADGTALPARNDRGRGRLVADIDDLGALRGKDGAALLAITAGPEGEEGSFKATSLALSGDWQVATGSGDFTYSYDVPLAKAPAGPTPGVSFDYSSAAVDGLVSGKNTQSGSVGLGWQDFTDAFIERRYGSCLDDGQVYADLCWKSDNATISLDGRSGELVPVPGSVPKQWRLKADPRWRIEQLTGADNGDDNGEHWRATSPDGVQYFFGRGVNPDVGSETSSVWTVPVFGDDPGEPCASATPLPMCAQAWRWNLDLVIDPHDNVQQYEYVKEINHYAALNGWPGFEHTEYVRSGVLRRIMYGKRRVGDETTPAAMVEFDTAFRCTTLADNCPAPTAATASSYPDTPADLMCFTATCTQHTPTFFTALRYTWITTLVNNGSGDGPWAEVDWVRLYHGMPDPDPGRTGDQKLFLTAIQRTGVTADERITLPAVTFSSVLLNNRADTGGGVSAMPHYRVGQVANEYGGTLAVTYGRPHPCPSPIPDPPNWDLNTRDCFPHWYTPETGTPRFAVFHNYVVTRTEQRDTVGGSPPMVTTYRYGDQVAAGLPNGAWHHDRDEFVPNSRQTWSEWRGYADVLVSQGITSTRYRLFRGMNGDRLAGDPFPGPGTRVARVSSLDGTVVDVADENWLAGQVLDEQSPRTNGVVESGVVHGYHAQRTVDTPGADPLDDAWFVAENDRTERRRNPAGNNFVRIRTQTAYNALLLFPERVIESGWAHVNGDERCSLTGYAFNVDRWMLDFPASVSRYGATSCTGQELTRQEFAYDGGAVGAAPTKGDRTTSRVKITSAPTWATTTATFDRLGRPLNVTDPNSNTTRTVYAPEIRYPATTTVTNQLGHTSTTRWFRLRQAPQTETDARGKETDFGYDALGRTAKVHLPTEQASGAAASYEYKYAIDPDRAAPPVVRTRVLQDTAGAPRYVDAWQVHDGWLRERQNHRLSPEAGKVIVADTGYDDRGLGASKSQSEAVTGSAGLAILPTPTGGWANDTTTAHDELHRPVWEITRVRGAYRRSLVTEYTHDTITVTPDPPAGGVTRTVTDAYQRATGVEELEGTAWRATTYGYDKADQLVSVRDPAGNTITSTYDMAGRKTATSDPDLGAWTYAYDPVGNQTRVTSASGVNVHSRYDALNRRTERHKDSATGPLLARWEYDAAGEQGLLNRTSRVEPSGTWVVDVAGYDDRSRATGRTWTVPAGVPGLSGSYTIGYGYDAAGHRTRTTYPAIGGLAAETVSTTYSAVGLAETVVGAEEYLWGAVYDDRSRPTWLLSGSRSVPFSRVLEYDTDQRVSRLKAGGGNTVLQDVQFGYDGTFGNVTDRNTTLNGQSWRECYDHDDRQRLVRAFTTTGTCATGTPGTGQNSYNQTYRYSIDGNLTQRVDGASTVNYTYPAAGGTRPHAPTAVGANSYNWTADGDLAGRTVNGQTETFTWTAERRLALVDDPDGDTGFGYDADGARLLRTTPTATTLYLEDHEITKPVSGTATAVRTYTAGPSTLAIRTTEGVQYLAQDNQGSVQLAVPSGTTTPSAVRAYQPYGRPRTTATMATDRGWIGQIDDATTGLSYLNARYYDPAIGRFLSPDPLFDPARPQTVNPYAYGLNNPTSFTDPSGLIPDDCVRGGIRCDHNGKAWGNAPPKATQSSASDVGAAEAASVVEDIRDLDSALEEGSLDIYTYTTELAKTLAGFWDERAQRSRTLSVALFVDSEGNFRIGVATSGDRAFDGRLRAYLDTRDDIIQVRGPSTHAEMDLIDYAQDQEGYIRSPDGWDMISVGASRPKGICGRCARQIADETSAMTRSPLYEPDHWSNLIYLESTEEAELQQATRTAQQYGGDLEAFTQSIANLINYRK